MRLSTAARLRAVALALAAALALGATACGDSDDDSGGNGPGASGSQERQDGGGSQDGQTGANGDSDEERAQAAVERLYAAIADGDPEGVCEQLNPAARQELADGGLGTESPSCAESFQRFLDEAERAGGLNLTLKAEVVSVDVDGDRAVAEVRFGKKGPTGDVPLQKVDGQWKLEAASARPND